MHNVICPFIHRKLVEFVTKTRVGTTKVDIYAGLRNVLKKWFSTQLVDLTFTYDYIKVLNLDKSRHWRIVGGSAYTGEGLLEGFDWLVQDIASHIYVLD
ncbi:putative P-loop containing nucleoside triphosphate hydrolase [Helianthus annuus]|nr:putative P-loop containing nucleoside triphosphate hydrolase [Helianthus annuus]